MPPLLYHTIPPKSRKANIFNHPVQNTTHKNGGGNGGFFARRRILFGGFGKTGFLVLYSLAMLLSMFNLSFIIARRTAHGARRTAHG
ncbi:MAG: hypothetical protein ACR2P4_08240 [Gammaproteobacteria bacterium]